MEARRRNPYRPGRGVAPPLLAGRESELAAVEDRLGQLGSGRMPERDLLFYGPRGNGKTTLLMEARTRAEKRGFRVEDFPVDALTARETLIRELQERAGLVEDRLSGLHLGPVGGALERASPTENIGRLLTAWITIASEPLVIVLDEVQALLPEVGRPFFNAVQSAKARSHPFLVLSAGTPDAPRQLRRAATHNERGFLRVRVGRLRRADTATALADPATASGRPMNGDAVAFSANSPRTIRSLSSCSGAPPGDAADRRDSGRITCEIAREGAAEAAAEIEDFHGQRFGEADERGVGAALEPLAALFGKRGGALRHPELAGLLEDLAGRGSVPTDRISLQNTLRDLGIIWETSPGRWEMGIPSFAEHILRRA